ncbi:hypothetical protein DIPPA_21808 [Diplonema papillatum]|nr:hypothetical protein DIPPA_21808 [Diplonema papillatum]|eukprot:gene5501-8373_t
MKRPRSQVRHHDEWEWCCRMCKGQGGGAVCPNCSAPRMEEGKGLLGPAGAAADNGRDWDQPPSQDAADFVVPTTPNLSGDKLTLHANLPFDEDHRVEFKECGFLRNFPSYNGLFEQPQDFFLKRSNRWRHQPRAPLPEIARAWKTPQTQLQGEQTQLSAHVAAHRNWTDDAREKCDQPFSALIRQLCPSFPDGHWLCKKVSPFFEVILVENVVAMLNSPIAKNGVLYLGVEDTNGRVMGVTLTYRQRSSLLYLASRALLTIHPRLTKEDLHVSFVPIFSDAECERPIPNHCIIKISIHPADPAPLYLHPRISKSKTGAIQWNALVPVAPVRRLGSVRKLPLQLIKQHIKEHCPADDHRYDAFF